MYHNLKESLLFLVVILRTVSGSATKPPHIVFIYADDLGWNDVSFHGSPEIPTPNIDALAMGGISLHSYYGENCCTPSRGALMTGKYPMRLGLQHGVLLPGDEYGLPLHETILPQRLRGIGYRTHIVGKWHLGYRTKEYTPIYRGFDTFFGYYNGYIDYFDYTSQKTPGHGGPSFLGVDLNNGTRPVSDFRGKYATHVFTEAAKDIIANHDTSKPLFLYLSQPAPHIGNLHGMTEQAPQRHVAKFMHIKDLDRRIYAGKVSALDESVGAVVRALRERAMLDNSVVVFASDNGADNSRQYRGGGSNYPLRGNKGTAWEGGVRLPALLWSPLLKLRQPRVSTQLMHVTDWLPTLYTAAGGSVSDLGIIDGISQWEAFLNDLCSPRTDLLNIYNQIDGVSALREGRLKVINGTTKFKNNHGHSPSGLEFVRQPRSMSEWVFANGSVVRDILRERGLWNVEHPDDWYESQVVTCEQETGDRPTTCDPDRKPCLFDVVDDPCEHRDLANHLPQVVDEMMGKVREYGKQALPASRVIDPNADPVCHDFRHLPWMDPEHFVVCDYASGAESSLAAAPPTSGGSRLSPFRI